ncbi:shikimate dehydrogenase [Kineococcus sp. GCM10028916]|uniref:shikimate dehydrogenase n=1 Tax=Kineococcus sp. GCM10028916 TaxID=3273394 RepID=UPI0036357820
MRYLVGLIGSGIGPSLTPALHEREAAELGMHCEYRRLDLDVLRVPARDVGRLLDRVRSQGWAGVNVTHPCKQLVLAHLDELDPDARELGAVNTVVFDGSRAVGHNTDTTGFQRSSARFLPDAELDRVVLVGAGGAGSAVAHALGRAGVSSLAVVDVDPARAAAVAAVVGGSAHGPADLPELLTDATGIVHATPTGMAAHPGVPFDVSLLRPAQWVAEVVYRPLETPLVVAARSRGCRVLTGGGMAVFQAVDAFRWFTGVEPDAERMLRHFEEMVR